MARAKDNLTWVIHLRISEKTKKWFETYANTLNISEADIHRLALAMFIRRGGVDYKDKD